eukprot:GHVR01087220.1.p1 GENE.GHVR01087220.1~~GHVR01087220.1.p1  ORF type:complete len:150 (+),score=21.51 GHVR01087220.1:186-635(+)
MCSRVPCTYEITVDEYEVAYERVRQIKYPIWPHSTQGDSIPPFNRTRAIFDTTHYIYKSIFDENIYKENQKMKRVEEMKSNKHRRSDNMMTIKSNQMNQTETTRVTSLSYTEEKVPPDTPPLASTLLTSYPAQPSGVPDPSHPSGCMLC